MIDINLIRTNPELVKENMKKKFQEHKFVLVDEVVELDTKFRQIKLDCDNLRQQRNAISQQIGGLMKDKKIEEANALKEQVGNINLKLKELETEEDELQDKIKKIRDAHTGGQYP